MKNLFLFVSFSLASLVGFAQVHPDSAIYEMPPPPLEQIDTTAYSDSSYSDFDFYSARSAPKNFEKFCVGSSTLLNSNGVITSKGSAFEADPMRSWNIHFEFAEKIKFANEQKEFGWGYAVGYGYQQIGLANNLHFHTYGNKTSVTPDSASSVTNNFRSFRLYAPVFIEYNYFLPSSNKALHVNLGANIGLRTLRYCFKEKSSNTTEMRIIDKSNMNYNYIIADAFIRVGIENFSVFLTKSMLPIFNSNAGVSTAFPLQFGIAFGDLN